jgi:hypothetical protein
MRADTVNLARFSIEQLWQACSLSTLPHYLPGSVPVYTENKPLTIPGDWAATANVTLQYSQCAIIQRQRPRPAVLKFLGHCLPYAGTTLGTEGVTLPQRSTAVRAGELDSGLEMSDGDSTALKVDVLDG